jgi:hypothetical protein
MGVSKQEELHLNTRCRNALLRTLKQNLSEGHTLQLVQMYAMGYLGFNFERKLAFLPNVTHTQYRGKTWKSMSTCNLS